MRILIVNHEFPPLEGGASNATFNLAREVAAQGHRVWVLTVNLTGGPRVSREHGVVIVRIPFSKRRWGAFSYPELLWFALRAPPVLRLLARRLKVDVVHAFFAVPEGLMVGRLSRQLGMPCVVSLRGSDVPGFREGLVPSLAYPVLRPLLRACWRRPRCSVVANSEGLRFLASRSAPDTDIGVIPNGVDCERFKPTTVARRADAPFLILTVAQLIQRKRIEALIRQMPAIRAQAGRDVRLTVVGRGPLYDELVRVAESCGVREHVEFKGKVEINEMPEEYRKADLLVLCSRREGMPNTVLEAMASGLPVIATRVESIDELITHGTEGFVVGQDALDEITPYVVRLVRNENERRTMGEHARERVISYSWGAVASAYIGVYQELAQG
ncbi:MAG: glycosyltransferase family 4 protein [Kiritimatiellae bacterium]|nr:glycosyltransferase family 4 protein [Kiritimatiellia bacterium]